jgi:hypothetical protein
MNSGVRSRATRWRNRLHHAWDWRSMIRGVSISFGGILFMFCCVTILTISSCTLG